MMSSNINYRDWLTKYLLYKDNAIELGAKGNAGGTKMAIMACPECKASLLGQHRAGCAWYAERILEAIVESIDDGHKPRVVPRRVPSSAPPPNDPGAKKHA
jgi:hypothetical protein